MRNRLAGKNFRYFTDAELLLKKIIFFFFCSCLVNFEWWTPLRCWLSSKQYNLRNERRKRARVFMCMCHFGKIPKGKKKLYPAFVCESLNITVFAIPARAILPTSLEVIKNSSCSMMKWKTLLLIASRTRCSLRTFCVSKLQ